MTNVAFHVITRSEILNMTGSDIPNTAGRVHKEEHRQLQSILLFTQMQQTKRQTRVH